MGFRIHHGVRIAAWELKRIKVGHGVPKAPWGQKDTMGEKCIKGRA